MSIIENIKSLANDTVPHLSYRKIQTPHELKCTAMLVQAFNSFRRCEQCCGRMMRINWRCSSGFYVRGVYQRQCNRTIEGAEAAMRYSRNDDILLRCINITFNTIMCNHWHMFDQIRVDIPIVQYCTKITYIRILVRIQYCTRNVLVNG